MILRRGRDKSFPIIARRTRRWCLANSKDNNSAAVTNSGQARRQRSRLSGRAKRSDIRVELVRCGDDYRNCKYLAGFRGNDDTVGRIHSVPLGAVSHRNLTLLRRASPPVGIDVEKKVEKNEGKVEKKKVKDRENGSTQRRLDTAWRSSLRRFLPPELPTIR